MVLRLNVGAVVGDSFGPVAARIVLVCETGVFDVPALGPGGYDASVEAQFPALVLDNLLYRVVAIVVLERRALFREPSKRANPFDQPAVPVVREARARERA